MSSIFLDQSESEANQTKTTREYIRHSIENRSIRYVKIRYHKLKILEIYNVFL